MNTTPHTGEATTQPTEAAPRSTDARPEHRLRSSLRRSLKRIVAFVVPPDDKIAQTWRWLL